MSIRSAVRAAIRSAIRSPIVRDPGGWWSPLYGNDVALAIDFANERTYNGGVQSTPTNLLTYTAPSPKLVYGADGLLGYAPHNLLLQSQDFTTTWTNSIGGTGVNPSVTANAGEAPDGTITADRVQFSLGGGTTSGDFSLLRQSRTGAGLVASMGVWIRSNDSNSYNMLLTLPDGNGSAITVTPTWQQFGVSGTENVGTIQYGLRLRGGQTPANSPTADVLMWGAQINLGPNLLTYIPTTSAARCSIPLDHDPVTLAPLGVLVEEQRTNLLTYSEQFDNAAWTKTACAVTANAAVAPDGTTTADLVTNTSVGGTHHITAAIATVGLAAHGASVYVKRGNNASVKVEAFGTAFSPTYANITYNFDTDTLTETTGTAERKLLSDGWVRVTAKFTASNTGCLVRLRAGSGNGTDDATVYIWGAQLEAGAFPTSYIPTVASQVTRAADNSSILTSAFPYDAAAGTLFAQATAVTSASPNRPVAILSDGTNNERVMAYVRDGNALFVIVDGGVTQAGLTAGAIANDTEFKMAAAWVANDVAATVDGGAVATDGAATLPTVTSLSIGRNPANASEAFNGHIASLAYWPTRKPDAYLQEVTA